MPSDTYKLMFGGNPDNEISLGYLEKGNATIKGKEEKTKLRKGNCLFPNRTEGWGRRLIRDTKTGKDIAANERIDSSHKDYYGKIEWLTWGHEDGYPIEARYKSGSSSLDYQYQITRLGMKRMEDDKEEEYNYLSYASGYQEFDIESNGLLCQFLRIHYLNEDSVSKNPDNPSSFFMFKEVREFNTREFESQEIDLSWEAVKIVKEANSFEKLKVLKVILSRITDISYDQTKENSLYDSLILYAGKQSKNFMNAIQLYKEDVSKLLELSKAYEALDTTIDGIVAITNPKKEMLIDEVPAKGDDMIDWLYDNCLEPRVFEALDKLKLTSKKFK